MQDVEIELSIIIPVYNDVLIGRALDSLVKYKDETIEIIVIDGNSDSNIKEEINKYLEFIDVYISENDKGPYDAANKGIKVCHGKWFLWFAADDELIVDISKILKKYSSNTDLICGNIVEETKKGNFKTVKPSKNLRKLLYHCSIPQPATIYKTEIVRKCGKYNTEYRYAADRELLLRLSLNEFRFRFVDENFVKFSYGGLSTSTRVIDTYKEDVLISKKYRANMFLVWSLYIARRIKLWF